MKLNDPFGRMERRHQVGFEAVRDSLRRNNVDTVEAAQKIIKDTKIRALKFLALAVVVLLLSYLLIPGAMLAVAAVVILAGAWVIAWTMNGERYIKRYIQEELSDPR